MALQNDQYSLSAQIDSHFGYHIGGSNQSSQAFTPSVSGGLSSVTISVNKNGSPGDLIVEIYAVDGSDHPTGTALASETIADTSIPATGKTKTTITFSSPPSLTGGTTYAIVLRNPTGDAGANSYDWRSAFNGQGTWYPDDAAQSTNSGSSWSTVGRDHSFMTTMSVATAQPAPDQFVFGGTAGGSFERITDPDTQFAQTFTMSETAQIHGVEIGVARNGNTTGTFTVAIHAVDGSNKPTGSALVSKTFNTSDLNTSHAPPVQFDFDTPIELTGSTRYAWVFIAPNAGPLNPGDPQYTFMHSSNVDQLSGEQFWRSTDDGVTWAGDAGLVDLQFATLLVQPVETTQTINSDAVIQDTVEQVINSDAFVGEETTQTIVSDALVVIVIEQTIDSDAFIGEETTQNILSDASVGAEVDQFLSSDAFVGQETMQTIDSDAVILITTTQTIDSDSVVFVDQVQSIDSNANIEGTTAQFINSKASISITNQADINSNAIITVRLPELKLFSSAAPSTEIGTESNPIVFTGVIAGETFEHPDNPFYLWNDRTGALNSVDAKEITVSVLSLNVEDENLGVSNGSASQQFVVAFPPVVEDEEEHPVVVKVNGVIWTQVDNFASSNNTDQHYTFDYLTGTITFGDDINGAIPAISATIEASYTPDKIEFGAEVEEFEWLGVRSFGVISNNVSIELERQVSTDNSTVQVSHTPITSVTAVWLDSDPKKLGTNYFTGGTFNAASGIVTLGTPLPGSNTGVLIDYDYTIEDDLEADYTQVGQDVSHEFPNPIPSNNAKAILLRLVPPNSASPSGVMSIKFRIKMEIKS